MPVNKASFFISLSDISIIDYISPLKLSYISRNFASNTRSSARWGARSVSWHYFFNASLRHISLSVQACLRWCLVKMWYHGQRWYDKQWYLITCFNKKKSEINCARQFTLDAVASRPVACIKMLYIHVLLASYGFSVRVYTVLSFFPFLYFIIEDRERVTKYPIPFS